MYECAWYHKTFLVHLSLVTKVVLLLSVSVQNSARGHTGTVAPLQQRSRQQLKTKQTKNTQALLVVVVAVDFPRSLHLSLCVSLPRPSVIGM